MKDIVFIFGGQGSQYYNMARELYEKDEVFRKCIEKTNSEYKTIAHYDVIDEIFKEEKRTGEELKDIKYSHPAIFMIEYATSQILKSMGICPDKVIGVSLGEYTAAVLAGCFDYKTALQCIAKQVELLLSDAKYGSMITILENPDFYYESDILYEQSELVAVNYIKHFVVSCSAKAVSLIEEELLDKGISFFKLPVGYGFHSELISKIEIPYKRYLSTQEFLQPRVPLILSSRKREVEKINVEYLWGSIRKPMYFKEAILSTIKNECFYIDLTPGSAMKNIGMKILNEKDRNRLHGIITPFGNEVENIQNIRRVVGLA